MTGFNETITVYNAVFDADADRDVYHRTVITGCSWFAPHNTGHNGTAFFRENVHKIRIPATARSCKTYVPPVCFSDPQTQYTLRDGDIIVRGVGADITCPGELEGKYNDRCNVAAVHDNRRVGLRHIYVEGK